MTWRERITAIAVAAALITGACGMAAAPRAYAASEAATAVSAEAEEAADAQGSESIAEETGVTVEETGAEDSGTVEEDGAEGTAAAETTAAGITAEEDDTAILEEETAEEETTAATYYEYSFATTEEEPDVLVTVTFMDSEDVPELKLTTPDGYTYTLTGGSVTADEIEIGDMVITIALDGTTAAIDITGGPEGRWTLRTEQIISLIAEGYGGAEDTTAADMTDDFIQGTVVPVLIGAAAFLVCLCAVLLIITALKGRRGKAEDPAGPVPSESKSKKKKGRKNRKTSDPGTADLIVNDDGTLSPGGASAPADDDLARRQMEKEELKLKRELMEHVEQVTGAYGDPAGTAREERADENTARFPEPGRSAKGTAAPEPGRYTRADMLKDKTITEYAMKDGDMVPVEEGPAEKKASFFPENRF